LSFWVLTDGRTCDGMRGVAGYSGTPLARKLGIRADARVALVAAPDDFASLLEELPDGVVLRHQARSPSDVVVCFVTRRSDLARRAPRLASLITEDGGLWIAWPKRASGVVTDLRESIVREIGLETGLVDNKVCAIDERWSGLRFVVRRADRTNGSHANGRSVAR
jgi:hypothetical protein